ncbi:hypothetical protein M8C21_030490 [Ambrosia artemisiifolia]|uniref:Uncharacterized protein n=1 Tax=Ambrosia artemisiifolia TaxID=4212 RepID=A0AAD5CW88_AMBAR|nr:hypothetical protein M8C21_030490 [Ambrosia artemisiifolia]
MEIQRKPDARARVYRIRVSASSTILLRFPHHLQPVRRIAVRFSVFL